MSSNSDLYFSPQFIEELGLPRSLQFSVTNVDWADNGVDAYTNPPLGDISLKHASESGQALGHGQASDSDPSGLSIGLNSPGGYFHMPGNVFNKPCDTVGLSSGSRPVHVEPTQYAHAPHVGSLDPYSTQEFDTPHAEYVDPYRTDWELRTHLFSNSQTTSPTYHINAGTLSGNASRYDDVRRGSQELGYELNRRESYIDPLHHSTLTRVKQIAHESQTPCYLYPEQTHTNATTDNNVPPARPNFYDSTLSSSYPHHSYQYQSVPRSQDPVPSTSSLSISPSYPFIPVNVISPPVLPAACLNPSRNHNLQRNNQLDQSQSLAAASLKDVPGQVRTPSNIVIPTAPHSLFSSLPYSVTPIHNAAPLIASSSNPCLLPMQRTQLKHRPILPAKKRARTPKKALSIIVPAIKDHRKMEQKWPNKRIRAQVRSQEWLDMYFPNRGPCTLCGEKSSVWRNDRSLEHLVSSHIIQVVKNAEHFNDSTFKNRAAVLVKTEAQFGFVREQIEQIKCSLCTNVTSLVVRKINMEQHLKMKHKELTDTDLWKNELSRLKALIPDKRDWYSYNDRFLYYFPRNDN